jgi:hypothetical protein
MQRTTIMTIRYLSALSVTTMLTVATFGFGSTPASAGEIATRCDWDGCSHIVCNDTGDRCHRFYSDDDRYAYRDQAYDRDSDYRYRGYADYRDGRGWHYDCDRDADNCNVRRDGYYDRYGY